jgi:hypothetical protein
MNDWNDEPSALSEEVSGARFRRYERERDA